MRALSILDSIQDELYRLREALTAQDFDSDATRASKAWHELRVKVYELTEGRCWYCGQQLTLEHGHDNSYHVDHMHPRSRGGQDILSNLTAACRVCYTTKNDKTVKEYREFLAWRNLGIEPFTPAQEEWLAAHGVELPALPHITFWGETVGHNYADPDEDRVMRSRIKRGTVWHDTDI